MARGKVGEWIRKCKMPRKPRVRWRPRVNVLAVLCEQVVYHLMWVVESVVLVGRLCFFLMRFGFKQL